MNAGLIVVGASAGGLAALTRLCKALSGRLAWPMAVVQHIGHGGERFLATRLSRTGLPAVVARSFTPLLAGRVHVAPSGYHLLVEDRQTLALSLEGPVHHCRPAIDPLLCSAARVFGSQVVAVILTGANDDGAQGCACVRRAGGRVLVQDPETAEIPTMPASALAACPDAVTGDIEQLAQYLATEITPCPLMPSGT